MSVFLTNLDDFIAPSQACINPFVIAKGSSDGAISAEAASAASGPSKVSLQMDLSVSDFSDTIQPDLIKTKQSTDPFMVNQKVATVSLNDCLACSGCITSAEAVLIQDQSSSKLHDKLSMKDSLVIVAISPQSLASIATFTSMDCIEVFLRLSSLLKKLGIHYTMDMSAVGDVSLVESREEFLLRYRNGRESSWRAPTSSSAISSTHQMELNVSTTFDTSSAISQVAPEILVGNIPMLASSCPGWVCYAEKTQPQSIPYISSTKSPQQLLGTIIKSMIFSDDLANPSIQGSIAALGFDRNTFTAKNVYIVSVQPCFDKKLEASRLDFYHEAEGYTEVDLVLSTTELWNLIEEEALAFNLKQKAEESSAVDLTVEEYLKNFEKDSAHGCDFIESLFRSHSVEGHKFVSSIDENGGSGGYLEHIARHAAEVLLHQNLWGTSLDYKIGRNPDIAELEIASVDMGKLKFARAYGFRNIQSIILKMKRGKCDYDFIEIMACPSGCLNGGGQLKMSSESRESPEGMRKRLAQVGDLFHDHIAMRPEETRLVKYLYGGKEPGSIGAPMSKSAVEKFHTRYHAVPKLELIAPLATKW